ncbi:PAS domain S-box protein [Agriterribacter sp.]|uniref:PAS domain-containing sensor histidine kinase n=1 Tax=Agriterribacter sp. TaxID=2821509 RepID=UPI002C8303AB|nr:PAS domain S-box protein [Agriterribacter sp.]HRO45520.1 PAS domain S-box protein [Agriterribacter sp.]HRQ17958.1 PAS domain S-box protein [Agriterribacter sp.]
MKGRPLSTVQAVVIFLLIALVWILCTDYLLLQAFGNDIRLYHYMQSFKGVAFVGLTAIVIYLIIRRNSKYFKEKYDTLVFNHNELETILSETNLGIARLNNNGVFLYANPFFCALTGYEITGLLKQHYSLIIKTEDNVELEYWDMMLKQGKLNRMKNVAGITTKSGEKLICNITINEVRDKSGVAVFILVMENITNRRKEQKQLEESLKRYNILSMATMEGLWDWNILSGQLYYNTNIKLLFGYDDADLQQGYAWWKDNIHPEDKDKILDKMDAALQIPHVTTINNEYRFICKDGSYKIITDCFSILRDSEGRAFRLIVSMHDVTEQRNLQQQLAEKEIIYRRQLARTVMDTQESERKKLAEELHDNVNQLLGVVKLYIEHSIANDKIRDGLLRKSNEYIDKVIEELRNLSKNLAPPLLAELGLEHSLISMAEAIEEVQPVTIRVDIGQFDEARLMDGHKLMLYRIVQEQLNNIVKHAHAHNVTVHIEQMEDKVLLVITDDGVGVDLTLDNGHGMGLRNIRNRIELYQGKINMDTAPGKGFVLNVEFEI